MVVVVVVIAIIFCVCCCSQLYKGGTPGRVIIPAPAATGTAAGGHPTASYTAANPEAVGYVGKPSHQQYPTGYPPYSPETAQYPPYTMNTQPEGPSGSNHQAATSGLGQHDSVPPPYLAAVEETPGICNPSEAPPPSYEDSVRS